MICIGFGHKARQGKGRAATVIHHAYPAETCVMGFADALYAHCRVTHGMRQKDGRLLQAEGERLRQLHGEDFWVRVALDRLADDPPAVALFYDARHLSEMAVCHERVRVERWHPDGRRFIAGDRDPTHISETALDGYHGWTQTFRNVTGARDAFDAAVLTWYAEVRRRYGLASRKS